MNIPKQEIKYKVKETFEIKSNDNKDIKLTIAYNEIIIYFSAEEINIFPNKEYCLYQSLEQLLKIDKSFRQFDNIKEVFDSIKLIISNKNLFVIKEVNNIKLKINNNFANKEFFINLPLKQKETQIESLIEYISSLDNKITNLENEIKDIKNELNEMKEKYKKDIEKLFKELEKNYMQLLFKDSNIVRQDEEDLIKSWFDKKYISAKLLLNANIDNNFWDSFYNKCGNKANTIIFIKTTGNLRFGGYTSQIWPIIGRVKDDKSFIFSLTKKEKYKVINSEYSISVGNKGWICIGGYDNMAYDLFLYNNLNSRGGGTYKKYYDIPGKNENHNLNGGNTSFKLANCEIYQIEFLNSI